jgi:two-component system response regulator HydG
LVPSQPFFLAMYLKLCKAGRLVRELSAIGSPARGRVQTYLFSMTPKPLDPTLANSDQSEPHHLSELYRDFLARLDRVAATEATVLLIGESGSGKGFAAERLHSKSLRNGRPLVTVNLAAISPTLIESELFGHEKGAFTGADRARGGFFRRAEGGTLVLDEIGMLPLEAQVTLLRVLQERVIEPLGGEQPVPVDVRIVATSSKDLEARVTAGEVRADLYYRLAVVPLEVPPLRSRLEDLSPLIQTLTSLISKRLGVSIRPLEAAAFERLKTHAWPGNVRELENALERVNVLGAEFRSNSGDLRPVAAAEFDFLEQAILGIADELASRALSHGVNLEAFEKAMIRAALEEHRGNLSAAARQIGLTRRAIEYRLSKTESDPAVLKDSDSKTS